MTRWTDFHELPDRAKLLIFGTLKPTKAQIALYQVGQFKCRVVGEEERKLLSGTGSSAPSSAGKVKPA